MIKNKGMGLREGSHVFYFIEKFIELAKIVEK